MQAVQDTLMRDVTAVGEMVELPSPPERALSSRIGRNNHIIGVQARYRLFMRRTIFEGDLSKKRATKKEKWGASRVLENMGCDLGCHPRYNPTFYKNMEAGGG